MTEVISGFISAVSPVSCDALTSSLSALHLIGFFAKIASGWNCMPEHKELDSDIMGRKIGAGEPWRGSAEARRREERKHSSNSSPLVPAVALEKQVT